jgi:hypothetical protein
MFESIASPRPMMVCAPLPDIVQDLWLVGLHQCL